MKVLEPRAHLHWHTEEACNECLESSTGRAVLSCAGVLEVEVHALLQSWLYLFNRVSWWFTAFSWSTYSRKRGQPCAIEGSISFWLLEWNGSDGCVAVAGAGRGAELGVSFTEEACRRYRTVKNQEGRDCNEYGQEKAEECVGRLFECTEQV